MSSTTRSSARSEPGHVFRAEGPLAASDDVLRVGTRGSTLAVAQTTTVAEAVAEATGLDVALVIVKTHGDTSRAPLSQLGGTGVFVSALRDALLAGECDFAVHSLKDLPTGPCAGIALGAIPARADARDALCARDGLTFADLPRAASVGTGSPRRVAQLLARRPDLRVLDLRGNIDTRLARVGDDLDAVVLAAAGLDRIGRSEAISERFPLASVPTAPGQGALAIEVREADLTNTPIAVALAALDHGESRSAALAERSMLAELEAGCSAPVGATARIADGRLHVGGTVYRLDGTELLEASGTFEWRQVPSISVEASVAASIALGREVARDLLERGAADLAPLGGAR